MDFVCKIRMNDNKEDSQYCYDIKDLLIINDFGHFIGWKSKKQIYYDILFGHDYYVYQYGTKLIGAESSNDEEYVRTLPNDSEDDNLLKLPRE